MPNPADYRYVLAPVPMFTRWGRQEYGAPDDAVGWIDLRALNGDGYGLFWGHSDMAPMTGGIDCGRGDCRDMGATAFANAWETRYGVRPAGGTLVASLVDVLTTKADPDGVAGPRPLMPEAPGPNPLLTVWMPGHSRVHAEKMDPGHPHFPQVQRILWIEQDEIEARALGAANATLRGQARDHARRVLDWQCEKYGLSKTRKVEWELLLPPARRAGHPGPLPHDTTLTESFNTSDGDTLGPDRSWTEVAHDVDVASNAAELGSLSATFARIRCEDVVSSSDHYCSAIFPNMTSWDNCIGHTSARFDSAAATYYFGDIFGVSGLCITQIKKVISGTTTTLGSSSFAYSRSDSLRWKIEANGSTLKNFRDSTTMDTQTDTSIASGTRGGFGLQANTSVKPRLDDWEVGDLAAAAVQPQLMLLGVGC